MLAFGVRPSARWTVAALVGATAGAASAEPDFSGESRTSLTYRFTVEDASALTEPVTRSIQWSYRPDLEPSGQACDPEVATRFLRE